MKDIFIIDLTAVSTDDELKAITFPRHSVELMVY